MNTADKLAMIEAALFMTEEPLTENDIKKILGIKKNEVFLLIEELKQRYENRGSGIMLSETGGYKLVVKPKYLNIVSKLTSHADLSRGLLRVLSIIAFKEPVLQSDIVKVIGNRTYEYVKTLEQKGLVKTEKHSRTRVITTTKEFENYFGVDKEKIKIMLKQRGEKGNEKKDVSSGNEIYNRRTKFS